MAFSKAALGGDRARQDGVVLVVVVGTAHVDDARAGLGEELLAFDLGGQGGAVAGQGQADRLVEAVHGVRGEHTRTRTAGRARILLNLSERSVTDAIVNSHHHGINEVEAVLNNTLNALAGLHGAARDKDSGDVQAHSRQKHTGGDLVHS